MLLVLILCLVCFLAAFEYYRSITRTLWEFSERLPGPKPLPLLGNILEFGFNTKYHFKRALELPKKYGTVFRLWIGPKLVILLLEPKYVEVLLTSQKAMEKSYFYEFMKPWFGLGLITSTGARWKLHRKLLTPAFHLKILEQSAEIFEKNANILVERFSSHVNGPEFDVWPYIDLCALDNVSESIMGVAVNAQQNSNSDYVEAVRSVNDIFFQRVTRPWLHPDFAFRLSPQGRFQEKSISTIHGLISSVIKTKRKGLKETKAKDINRSSEEHGIKQRLALLDLMIQTSEDGFTFTDEDIRQEVGTFMTAAFDTTSVAISYCLWNLSKHQNIQDKVVEELKDIFGDSDRVTTFQDLQDMRYLEMVIKESLRTHPSVMLIGRHVTENIKTGDYLLPAGADVFVSPYYMHRNADNFPDPEKFDPERFTPENSAGRHPYSYIPFSAGPRNCIGHKFAMLEIKSVISKVLRKFKVVESDSKEELNFVADLILKASNGVKLKLVPRKIETG